MSARRLAAELLGDYLGDRISGGQLEESWPSSGQDAALEGIAGVIFPHVRGGRLSEEYDQAQREDLGRILGRCRSFLLCELPYGWGDVGAHGCLNLGIAAAMFLLGLMAVIALFAERIVEAALCLIPMALLLALRREINDRRGRMRSLVSGDLRYWPFDREEDLSAVEAQTREPPAPGVSDAGPADPERQTP